MNPENKAVGQNPLEMIFTLNLQDSLIKFQRYSQQVDSEMDALLEKSKRDYAKKITENPLDKEALSARRDEELKSIVKRFELAKDILMEQYDSHMKSILPNPSLLPVRLNVKIFKPSSGETISLPPTAFQLKPYETLDFLLN